MPQFRILKSKKLLQNMRKQKLLVNNLYSKYGCLQKFDPLTPRGPPPSTFSTLATNRDIFMDPDPFVNSYFGLSFDLRRYLAQSDIFEVVKLGLEKNNFGFLHSELVTRCILGQFLAVSGGL